MGSTSVETILSSITNAFWTLDAEWRFCYFNPEAERLLSRMQRRKEWLVGRKIWEEFPNLVNGSKMYEVFCRVATSRRPEIFEEYYPLMDVHLEVHAYPSEQGIAVYCNDITARKLAEAALQESYESLEQRVRERTRELRELLAYIDSIRENEQARIGREIHDHLGQLLSLLRMDLTLVRKRVDASEVGAEVAQRLARLDELVCEVIQATRELAATLRPRILDDLGLLPALEWLLQRAADSAELHVSLVADPPGLTLDPDRSTALFRIVQEAIANVLRHAEASRVDVRLCLQDGVVRLTVADDGRGLAAELGEQRRCGMGILNMRERAARFGGTLELRAGEGGGTVLQATIPLHSEVVACI